MGHSSSRPAAEQSVRRRRRHNSVETTIPHPPQHVVGLSSSRPAAEEFAGEPLQYESLGNGEIRVLELHPGTGESTLYGSLKNVSLTASPVEKYTALSYTWGSEMQTHYPMIINGQVYRVRENLWSALLAFRFRETSRPLWIDAICINQLDNEEKKTQIPLMGLVYSKAEMVEIWLGPEADNSGLALSGLRGERASYDDAPKMLRAMCKMLQRPWYFRVWIMQEVALAAPNALFVNCGHVRMDWDSFVSGMDNASPDKLYEPQPVFATYQTEVAIAAMELLPIATETTTHISSLQSIREMWLKRSRKAKAMRVGYALGETRKAQSTFAKDKLFGVCGLLEEKAATALMQSYNKPIEETYFAATSYVLQHEKDRFFLYAYPTLPLLTCKRIGIPSWTLDFSFSGNEYAEDMIRQRKDPYQMGRDSATDAIRFPEPHGKRLATGASFIGTIQEIVPYSTRKAEIPSTNEAWAQFRRRLMVCIEENNLKRPRQPDGWPYDRLEDRTMTVADDINRIAFLQKAKNLHSRASSTWNRLGMGEAPSLCEVLAGCSKEWKKPNYMAYIESELGILLQELEEKSPLDRTWEASGPLPGSRAITLAFGLRDEESFQATERCSRASNAADVPALLNPRNPACYTAMFATESGLCGISLPGVRVGDKVARVFRESPYEMHAILREEEGNQYSFVCVADVPDVWIELCSARGTLDPAEVVLV